MPSARKNFTVFAVFLMVMSKKSGNHDDFVNFCGNRGEVYYLHLWLQEKPQMESLVLSNLPHDVFFDSGRGSLPTTTARRSPTVSESSFNVGARGRTSLAASVGALVENRGSKVRQLINQFLN